MRSDTDLVGLADRLADCNERRFSLCLQGPPGTGKSACVRYLADRLGLEVVQKRASDLMSPWVGQTERKIAEAFREARDEEAFLVFDEADSLLADRRHAVRNWEVSQTNEMLTWMESHPLPFACTTNFADRLDAATLRRFVFKIALDYLAPGQAASAFRGYFGIDAPPEVSQLSTLTPGDFAVVRKKAEILQCLDDPPALAGMLREECHAKEERRSPIGFSARSRCGGRRRRARHGFGTAYAERPIGKWSRDNALRAACRHPPPRGAPAGRGRDDTGRYRIRVRSQPADRGAHARRGASTPSGRWYTRMRTTEGGTGGWARTPCVI